MKRFLSLSLAGALGAIVTIAVYHFVLSPMSQGQTPAMTMQPDNIHTVGFKPALHVPPHASGAVDFTVAAERAMPAVVQIKAAESDALAQQRRQEQRRQDPWSRFFDFDLFDFPFGQFGPRQGAGSGVILTQDGYIVTNNHVVDFADQIVVRLQTGDEHHAELIGRDPSTDLAVIKIEGQNLPILELADSDQVKVGEWVLAVGNPFEYLTSTVTAGIISAVGRDINVIRGERAIEEFIQTDAAINPGNSGGALVDDQGRLLGINTAIASSTGNYAGYSFAIPVNLMVEIVDDIIETGGVIERTNLGVFVEELDAEYAEQLGLRITEGLIVKELEDGGAAQYAGILPNDVIVAVNGKDVSTFEELGKVIELAKVGDILEVRVYRDGMYKNIDVRLRKRL